MTLMSFYQKREAVEQDQFKKYPMIHQLKIEDFDFIADSGLDLRESGIEGRIYSLNSRGFTIRKGDMLAIGVASGLPVYAVIKRIFIDSQEKPVIIGTKILTKSFSRNLMSHEVIETDERIVINNHLDFHHHHIFKHGKNNYVSSRTFYHSDNSFDFV